MGDREWPRSRIRPRAACDVFSKVVAALGELLTAKAEEVSRSHNRGPGRPSSKEGVGGHVQSSFLFSETALEEPFRMAEGG
jgi:hypothetical protein